MSIVINLEDVKFKGVGEVNLDKLRKAGITTVNSIAILTAVELVSYTGMGIETAQKTIEQAREMVSPSFISGEELHKIQMDTQRHDTGSRELNRILGGGLRGGAITEFIGEFGSGKSQIMLTSMVECAANHGVVLDIDTEGTHLETRIVQIATERGYDAKEVLKNIKFARAFNSDHLITLVKVLPNKVAEYDAKMVIVDSIISHFRSEYIGLGMLAEGKQKLAGVIHMLTRVAEGFRIPVIVTNQVQTKVGVMFGDPNQAAGGNIMGHGGTYRVMLRKGKIDNDTNFRTILACVIDSAELMEEKVRIMLSKSGVIDVDGSYPSQRTLEEVMG